MSHISIQKFSINQINDKMQPTNLDATLTIEESKLPIVHGHGLSSRATVDENPIESKLEQRFDATIENIDGETVPGTGKRSKMSKMMTPKLTDQGVQQKVESRAVGVGQDHKTSINVSRLDGLDEPFTNMTVSRVVSKKKSNSPQSS